MGLDYTKGAVNFRDLGLWLSEIEGRDLMPAERVFRGGKLEFVNSLAAIGSPRTIVNLRRGEDADIGVAHEHFFVPAGVDTNHTHRREVRVWLNRVMQFFSASDTAYPVYMHCTSGKDRTGIVAGVIGLVVGSKLATIEAEYALSEGNLQPRAFGLAMQHIQEVGLQEYLDRVDVNAVRSRLLGSLGDAGVR